ncbi:MAG: type II secretion system F family protein [Peptococcaceae bacterium]|nr:type II secretion system F family protein [Peptococcaceae bacterium]
MQFNYKVIDETKTIKKGTLQAADREAAKRMMLENKWQIIELQEGNQLLDILNKAVESKLSYESISSFCTQMAMMIRTGANLVKGLEILKAQSKDKNLQRVITTLITEVSRGSSLSAAMRTCGRALPELLVNLVAVGEQSGNLDTVLNNMAEYYDRENFIRKKIASASVYPAILTSVLVILVIFFINFILPEITGLLNDSGGQLPLITQIMINSAGFLTRNFLLLIVLIIGLVAGYFKLHSIPKYKLQIDGIKLKIPLLGKNIKNVITARFCRTMALFLKASIPIVPILDSMEKIVGNEVSRMAVVQAKEKIIKGKGLAASFGEEKFFDEMVIQMMTIGEETGQLDDLMEEIAKYYDKQVEIGIGKMVALVEPVFTIIIGIFAGLMVISVALPIFNMSQGIK